MTSTLTTTAPVDRERGVSRPAGRAGLLYVVFLVAGIAVLGTPEGTAPDETWQAHFNDDGARHQVLLGGLLVVLSGLAFLVAIGGLIARVEDAVPRARLAAAGTAHAVLVILAGMWGASMALMKDLAGMPVPGDADLLRLSDALMFGTLLLPGLLTAGVVAFTGARSGRLPRALAATGVLVAVLSVAGLALLPLLLWLVWFAAVSVMLAR